MEIIKSLSLFFIAGLGEIGGGFLIWLHIKENKIQIQLSPNWCIVVSLTKEHRDLLFLIDFSKTQSFSIETIRIPDHAITHFCRNSRRPILCQWLLHKPT